MSAYPEALLVGLRFDHIDIAAASAGSIKEAKDWSFTDTHVQTADGSAVEVTGSQNVTGLPGKPEVSAGPR